MDLYFSYITDGIVAHANSADATTCTGAISFAYDKIEKVIASIRFRRSLHFQLIVFRDIEGQFR